MKRHYIFHSRSGYVPHWVMLLRAAHLVSASVSTVTRWTQATSILRHTTIVLAKRKVWKPVRSTAKIISDNIFDLCTVVR